MKIKRPHHQDIWNILSKFDSHYLAAHSIWFGGGTRIALELNEYRESIDIDFLCSDSDAYKAVRSQVTSESFGRLLRTGETLPLAREIRTDRDAVRTFVSGVHGPIKLEFVHFEYYDLDVDSRKALFPVPCIDQASCFLTKLLANADRYANPDKKDIFDLCMMAHHWGGIPDSAWKKAEQQYGLRPVYHGLETALTEMAANKEKFKILAGKSLSVDEELANKIIEDYAPALFRLTSTRQAKQ